MKDKELNAKKGRYVTMKINNPFVSMMPGAGTVLQYGLIYEPCGASTPQRDKDFVAAFDDKKICERVTQFMNGDIKEKRDV